MKRILLTLIAISFAGAVRAQLMPGSGERVISFEEAFYLMNTRNDRIVAADYEEEAAEKEKKAAFGLRLPNVGVTGAYAYMSDDIGFDLNGAKKTDRRPGRRIG